MEVLNQKHKVSQRLKDIRDDGPIDYQALIADFLEKPRLSSSSLKPFLESPWHFIQYKTKPRPPKKSFSAGNIFELLLLEPEKVDDVLVEKIKYTGTGSQAKNKAWAEENNDPNKIYATAQEIDNAMNMYKRAIHHPEVQLILDEKDVVQEKIFWKDRETGLLNLSILDIRSSLELNPAWITDLKTARSAESKSFQRDIFNYGYDLQSGGYWLAVWNKYFTATEYKWLVVENDDPYGINVFKADSNMLNYAKNNYLKALKNFQFCAENNLWHMSYDFWRLAPYEVVRKPYWLK